MEIIKVDDIVISSESAVKLVSTGWKYFFDTITEEWVFDRIVWVDPTTYDIYEWKNKRYPEVIIRVVTDSVFHFRSMDFFWKDKEYIPENSDFGKLLAEYLSMLIEDAGYLSFKNDIGHFTLSDFPEALEYISRRCDEVYGIAPPLDVPILISPENMWSTWGFSKGVEALYSPTYEFIVIPDKKWKSQRWQQSLIIHEFTHSIQHTKKWLIHPRDIGLTQKHIMWIGEQFSSGKSIEEIAEILQLPISVMKRAKGLVDYQSKYQSKYFEIPVEVHAFGEQYEFLKMIGLSGEQIFNAIFQYMKENGIAPVGRDKDQLFGMIDHSSQNMKDAITELEGLVTKDDPDEGGTYSPTAFPSLES